MNVIQLAAIIPECRCMRAFRGFEVLLTDKLTVYVDNKIHLIVQYELCGMCAGETLHICLPPFCVKVSDKTNYYYNYEEVADYIRGVVNRTYIVEESRMNHQIGRAISAPVNYTEIWQINLMNNLRIIAPYLCKTTNFNIEQIESAIHVTILIVPWRVIILPYVSGVISIGQEFDAFERAARYVWHIE